MGWHAALRDCGRVSNAPSSSSPWPPRGQGWKSCQSQSARTGNPAYLVQLPRAEARHLAGVGPCAWPASPEAACLHSVREWLAEIRTRASSTLPARRVVADLELILSRVHVARVPSRGPFAPCPGLGSPPGRVEYLGGGVVRLDDDAVATLAGLGADEDFRVVASDGGPVLVIGKDRYLAREE